MAMRLSGLISGMDTEAVIRELMNAERLKTTKVENKITTTEWKQEKWSALNTKIYSFYTNQLSKMRMQGSFAVKKASSSNESKVELTAGTNAPEGTHLVKVNQLASSQFVTGAIIEKESVNVNLRTKLVDLDFNVDEGTTISIKADKEVNFDVRANSTLGDFVNALKDAGLNANYDTVHNRLFISSKNSGEDNAFLIEANSSDLGKDRNDLRDFIGYDSLNGADKKKVDSYLDSYLIAVDDEKISIKEELLNISNDNLKEQLVKEYEHDQADIERITNEEINKWKEQNGNEDIPTDVLEAAKKSRLEEIARLAIDEKYNEYLEWKINNEGLGPAGNEFAISETELNQKLTSFQSNKEATRTSQNSKLKGLGLNAIIEKDGKIVKDVEDGDSGAKLVNASDAIIEYNGAVLTGSSNNFSVNGLNLTLKGKTDVGETISLSVSNNTEAVYDMVKDFVNAYNELLKEMNDSYNAESARGYDPLTDEEREAMSESEIEKWESRIQDSLLRRDNTLGGLISSFRTAMSGSVSVNGKSYSLASFGIGSQNYRDKGTLYINGDEDNDATAGLTNKLMDALNNNPEEVMTVMNKLSNNLYSSLMDKMKRTSLSSALTVYNDQEISKTLTNYKDDLKKLEDKLADIEERYYKQFAAMETAMAKLNSQSSALASMLGMNMQG